MTSNIPGGRAGAEGHFRPEFINRLDDIVEFDALSRDQIGAIVDLQVERRVLARVAQRGITATRSPRPRASCWARWATTRPTAPARSSA